MADIRAFIIERINALFDFGDVIGSSVGASKSVELDVRVDADTDKIIKTYEEYKGAEIWDHPAVLWRPSDPETGIDGDRCEFMPLRIGDEIIVTAGKERRWQISISKGEVAVRGLAAGSGHILFKTNGLIEAKAPSGSDLDFVALAAKVNGIISDIHDVFNTWVPAPPDGGAALQVAWKLKFGTPPSSSSVASSNFKAEK